MQLEDAGHIAIAGYSAGARSQPYFGWARNLRSKKTDEGAANLRICQAFSLVWNIAKGVHPPEVAESITSFTESLALPPPHPDPESISSLQGPLLVPGLGGHVTVVPDADKAPIAGVVAQRYARAVHHEPQPHKFSIYYTATRSGAPSLGGNFVIASHGILVENAPDTSVAWSPTEWHTTTLGMFDPAAPPEAQSSSSFDQVGIAFVTSSRLPAIFSKWRDATGFDLEAQVQGALNELGRGGEGACEEEIYE